VDHAGLIIRDLQSLLDESRGAQPRSTPRPASFKDTLAQPPIFVAALATLSTLQENRPAVGVSGSSGGPAVGVSGSSGVSDTALSRATPVISPMPTRQPPCASQASPANPLPKSSDGMKASNVNLAASEVGIVKREPENALPLAASLPVPTGGAAALSPRNDDSFLVLAPKWAKANPVVANLAACATRLPSKKDSSTHTLCQSAPTHQSKSALPVLLARHSHLPAWCR
jgi:hypothetical protein